MKKFLAITSVIVLAIVLATMLMACTPSADSVVKKYEDKGYEVKLIDDETALEAAALIAGGDLEYQIIAANEDGEAVTIYCFKNSDDAKKFYEDGKESLEEGGSYAEAMDIKKSGNAVAAGTKEAVKIF